MVLETIFLALQPLLILPSNEKQSRPLQRMVAICLNSTVDYVLLFPAYKIALGIFNNCMCVGSSCTKRINTQATDIPWTPFHQSSRNLNVPLLKGYLRIWSVKG